MSEGMTEQTATWLRETFGEGLIIHTDAETGERYLGSPHEMDFKVR
jgi:hypothetical protein